MSASMVSKIGAIGDIHEEDEALERVLQFLKPMAMDAVVAVGDIVDGPGDGARCCDLLQAYGVDAVSGNHDRWFLLGQLREGGTAELPAPARNYLEELPSTRSYQTPMGRLMLCHGLAENDMNRLREDDEGYALQANGELQKLLATQEYRYIINGHSHRRMVRDFGGVTVINAGTIFRDDNPCCVVLDFDEGTASFYDLQDGAPNASSVAVHRL